MGCTAEIAKIREKAEGSESKKAVLEDVADDPSYLCFETGAEGGTDSGRSTPAATFGAKSELFGKQKERPGSQASGSRPETPADAPASEPEPAPAPAPAPEPAPAPAPAPAEEEEEEESDDDWS